MNKSLSISRCVELACVWEVTARKAGNVHRFKGFEDAEYADFLASAVACAPVFDYAPKVGVGWTTLKAIQRSREVTDTNTNLGIALLMAPLAAVPHQISLSDGIAEVLSQLTIEDATRAYEAIRLANPGGLGHVDEADISEQPTGTLLEMMGLGARHDMVARQYVNHFTDVLEFGIQILVSSLENILAGSLPKYVGSGIQDYCALEIAIISCHLKFMAEYPDSLIARKCGQQIALESAEQAATVLKEGWPWSRASRVSFAALDDWLRADGHRRNPGTSADLVAATLFAALRENKLTYKDWDSLDLKESIRRIVETNVVQDLLPYG